MSDLRVVNVSKSFGRTQVLRDISVTAPDGEFLALVGPSGCGKSTLLRILAGLEDMDQGQILIGDVDVSDLAPRDRDIAMVFQSYALYPHMNVAENMAFSMKLRRLPKEKIEARVREAATILDLSKLLERFPRELSGGQRQRVAMGRAIVRDPEVFLFDEPLSNLDAKLRIAMRTELKALHQRLQTTTIYVTHDQIEAMTMADRIVVMRDGIIEQQGAPLDLYDQPANLFVASFIGAPSMNFLPGSVVLPEDAHVRLDCGLFWYAGDLNLQGLGDGRRVVVGVRPEHLSLAQPGDDDKLKFEVIVVEPTGAETHIYGKLGSSAVSMILKDRCSLKPGDRVDVKAQRGCVHFFDAETELRLD